MKALAVLILDEGYNIDGAPRRVTGTYAGI